MFELGSFFIGPLTHIESQLCTYSFMASVKLNIDVLVSISFAITTPYPSGVNLGMGQAALWKQVFRIN